MADYVNAQLKDGKQLFLHSGTAQVAGFASNLNELKGGGADSCLVIGKEIQARKHTSTMNDFVTHLTLVVPKYLSVASMVCSAFGDRAQVTKLVINSTAKQGQSKKIIGNYTFEDGYIEDYAITNGSIEINFEFAKLSIEDLVSNTMGVADSRHS